MAASFVPARGLQLRMLVALAVDVALLAATLVLIVWVATTGGWHFLFFAAMFIIVGGAASVRRVGRRRAASERGRDHRGAVQIVERLALVADRPPPDVVIEPGKVPLAWTSAVPWRRPSLHLTRGLFDALDDRQLAAVIAHELSHVVNRDAVLMTVLAGPGVALLRGARDFWFTDSERFRSRLALIMFGWYCLPVGVVLVLSARIVSRQRELAADRGAAMLTGSPAAVADALAALDERLRAASRQDLRKVAAGDVFHIVPADPRSGRGLRRMWATHPPMKQRLAQLGDLERALQR